MTPQSYCPRPAERGQFSRHPWAPVDIECGREKYIDGAPQGYRVPTSRMVVVCIRPGVGDMGAETLRWAIREPRHWAEEEI